MDYSEMERKYDAGEYVISPACYDTCTANWTKRDWINCIDFFGHWTQSKQDTDS